MRFYLSAFTEKGIKTITIEHKSASFTIEARTYIRASRFEKTILKPEPDNDPVFREINEFIATLPMDRQDRLWQCYTEVKELFEVGYDPITMTAVWRDLVSRIYQELPYEEIYEWAQRRSVISMPLSLKTSHDDKNPQALTYLRQDYFDLAVLAIACRPMVPIWGEYIPRLKDSVDNTFKEYTSVGLLIRTYIPQCPPYRRLLRYITAYIEANTNASSMFSALLKHLSSSSMPDWLLACTLVRRTSIVPIACEQDGPNIITDVHQYVKNMLKPNGNRRWAGPITEKRAGKDEKADHQESLAESYKIKQEIPDGDVEMAEAFIEDAFVTAKAIEPSVTDECIEACLETMRGLLTEELSQHHMTLTQFVLASGISMRILPLISKQGLIRAMAATQAVLWTWGFHDLAALLGATEIMIDEDEFVSSQEVRSDKLSKEVQDKLSEIYPHRLPNRSKTATERMTNPGYVAVDAFYDLVAGKDWHLHGPEALLPHTSRNTGSRTMYVPVDLRMQVANLLIKLYEARALFRERTRQRIASFS